MMKISENYFFNLVVYLLFIHCSDSKGDCDESQNHQMETYSVWESYTLWHHLTYTNINTFVKSTKFFVKIIVV